MVGVIAQMEVRAEEIDESVMEVVSEWRPS